MIILTPVSRKGIFPPKSLVYSTPSTISRLQKAISWSHNEMFAHWKFRGRAPLTYEFVPNLVRKCDFQVRVARDFQIFLGFDLSVLIGLTVAHLLSVHGVIALVFARFTPAAIFSLSCDWLIWKLKAFLHSANHWIKHLSSFRRVFIDLKIINICESKLKRKALTVTFSCWLFNSNQVI